MAWIESPYRKKRTRYYNNKKAELERLNAKWTNEFRKLGVGNALDRASTAYQGERTNGMLLSYYEIHNPAQHIRTKARLTAMISAHHHRRYHQMKLYHKMSLKVKF